MTRFRLPQTPGSKYVTAEGALRLRAELDELWRHERPRVTQAVAEAAAQGDRSENAERHQHEGNSCAAEQHEDEKDSQHAAGAERDLRILLLRGHENWC